MGMDTQDFYSYINPSKNSLIIDKVHQICTDYGLIIETGQSSFFALTEYEIGDDEFYFEPKLIQTEEEGDEYFQLLKNHVAGGSIGYADDKGFDYLVSYGNIYEELNTLNYISVSVQYSYYVNNQAIINKFISNIHNELQCIRTIGGWNEFPWNFHSDLEHHPLEYIKTSKAENMDIDHLAQ